MGSLGKAKLLAGMAILMLVLWLWQLRSGDAGTVNVGWSAGIGILALVYALTSSGSTDRRLLLAILAGGWSFRLAGYLFLDRVRGAKEDGRYRELRQSWENRAQTFFLIFFQAQALLALLFSLPLLVVAHDKRFLLQTTDLAALILFVGSVLGESIADRQLARFRSQPGNDGKTCRQGPWRYSRHPNYFFEWLHWWTYVLMGWGAPYGWTTLLGPALMLFSYSR